MSELGLGQQLNVSQTLDMVLSPRMIQMLKILNLSYVDLLEEVEKKSEENVMLEVERPDRLLEFLRHIEDRRIPKKEITGEELPGIETLADTAETLEEHLIKQIDLEDLDETQREICEALIDDMDDRGYIKDYPQVSASMVQKLSVDQKAVDDMLMLIQSFEPEGVGARSLKECLLIQIREYNFETPELEDILTKTVEHHLEDLAEKKFEKAAKALKINKDGVEKLAEFIKNNLNPDPGTSYSAKTTCVIPSFLVKKEKGTYTVVDLEKTYGPVVKLSANYIKMLKDPATDHDSVEFLKNKLESAKEFLENMEKRHDTLEKILNMIISRQTDFLDDPNAVPKPLMQKNIADFLGLHPSTISRAVSNKFIQSPKGVLLLKDLCPREVKGTTSRKIRRMIEELIKREDKNEPLSDENIARTLQSDGIDIDRRTIASYRKRIGAPIASRRTPGK